VPKTAREMRKRDHSLAAIDRLIHPNPAHFLSQWRNFLVAA
jgi:hypothetical protein